MSEHTPPEALGKSMILSQLYRRNFFPIDSQRNNEIAKVAHEAREKQSVRENAWFKKSSLNPTKREQPHSGLLAAFSKCLLNLPSVAYASPDFAERCFCGIQYLSMIPAIPRGLRRSIQYWKGMPLPGCSEGLSISQAIIANKLNFRAVQ